MAVSGEALTKQRGDRAVVSDVTFRYEPGTITGFLGPAGKTTPMRTLVGLPEPGRGAARILGERHRDLPNPGRRVGILLDASAQHPGRRGREALAVAARTMAVPAQRVNELRRGRRPRRNPTELWGVGRYGHLPRGVGCCLRSRRMSAHSFAGCAL